MSTEYLGHFAQELSEQLRSVKFGTGTAVSPLTTPELVERVTQSPVGKLDYRSVTSPNDRTASVFEGLEFDPQKLRTQAFVVASENEILGLMTFVIAPRVCLDNNKYLMKDKDGVTIIDLPMICGGHMPDFVVSPGFAKVNPAYKNEFALPGVRALIKTIQTIEKNAPLNTWLEMVATGQFPPQFKDELKPILELNVGTHINFCDLPFGLDIFGKNNPGSSSTVKIAPLLGLKHVENVAALSHLGPVFNRQIN